MSGEIGEIDVIVKELTSCAVNVDYNSEGRFVFDKLNVESCLTLFVFFSVLKSKILTAATTLE